MILWFGSNKHKYYTHIERVEERERERNEINQISIKYREKYLHNCCNKQQQQQQKAEFFFTHIEWIYLNDDDNNDQQVIFVFFKK